MALTRSWPTYARGRCAGPVVLMRELGAENRLRDLLDTAVAKFKGAGCAEADIEQALKVHRGVRAEK